MGTCPFRNNILSDHCQFFIQLMEFFGGNLIWILYQSHDLLSVRMKFQR